jgi:Lon protease-like protein
MRETVKDIVTIPLFPLGVVILPDMILPLHIFEERYKLMISECMAEDQPFGIVLFEGQYMRTVGCMARVTEVIKLYADGRMDILTRGETRFIIQKVIDEKPYLEAHVNFFEDIDKPNLDELQIVIEKIRILLGELYEMDQSSHHYRMMAQSSPLEMSFAIAALDGFTPAERQKFLEMTSTSERIVKGADALTRLAQRIRLTNEINRIIGGNGNPPKQLINLIGRKKQD